MFEKSLRRDQENILVSKRPYFSSQAQSQRRDIRLAENRVLQETQQNLKSNGLLFKPQRLSQEHSTLSNTSGQYEKINGNQISLKGSDKEQKLPLKDVISPTASAGVSDISYRIVNEILNAQHGNRNQLKLKAGSRMMERTKSPRVLAQTSCDNLTDAIRGVKAALEDNEELNSIDGKINEAKRKLEDKKRMLEASRRRYDEEIATVEQREKILNKEHNRLKSKLEKSGVKTSAKEKPNLSTDKEKLKHLRGELQNHEKELTRLNKILQKQENEKSDIEKIINQDFEKQVADLEEAMLSIEEQKLEIYAKLNEAILSHTETLEQKAMMKEDLGGRLIQRADLVAQREDLEQAMDNFKQNNTAETEFYFIESQINQELGALETALYDLDVKRDNLKKQLKSQEHRDNKSYGALNLERMKKDWFELCEIEKMLSHKAEEAGLSGIDGVYSRILGQYGVHIEKNKIWEYMLDIAEETSEDEPEDSVRIRLKGKIREEAIENWKDHERERLDEILIQAEQKEFISLYKKFCEKIKDYDEDVAEERRGQEKLHETPDNPEEELKKVEKEIQEKEARKEELENELDKKREKLESAVIGETENAFQAYLQDQADTFETIKAKHGIEAAEDMKRQYHREFLQIAQNDLLDKLSHYRSLQDDIKYLDQTIKNNTTIVDAKILPELQNLLPSLEEDSILVTALKQQQIHLLETEDEVAEQLNSVFENRAEKIKLSHQKYDKSQATPPHETQEAKNSYERKITFIKEEITKVENHMIEVDKLATEGHSGDIRLQSELKGVDKELHEIITVKKPSLHELHMQIGNWDKELKELEKSIEQLEMQKLGLEQQFIEQNYLNDELAHQGHTPKSTMHKRSSKTLNFDLKENTSVDRQPETTHVEKERKDKSRMTQSLKNNMIKGLMEIDFGSTKNASRSPMERVSPGPVSQKNKPKRDFFDNLNILSQQELSTEKGLMNTWTCFSPPGSVLLGGISQKIQEKINDSKEKTRERKSHGHRDDLLHFRSQQKRPAQRQNTTSDSIDKANTVNLDTRTNSLPQSFNPNIRKSEEGMLLNQTVSPKGPEILARAPSANQTRESYNEETLQKSYMTYFDKPKNSGPSYEGLNVSSPKALNLHINSLISQAGLQNVTQNYQSAKEPEKPLSEVQLRYREFIRQSGDLPRGDLLRENFTTEELFPKHREETGEGERSKARIPRGNKPSLNDRSLALNRTGDESGLLRKIDPSPAFKNREENSNFLRQSRELNDTVNKKKPHSLQEIIGEIRRGRKETEVHKDNQEEINRSKSIEVQKGKKDQKSTGHTGEKLSFRDRAEGSHGKLELSDMKSGMHPIRMLVSPSSKTPSGLSESKEFQELKSKINDQSIQETLFFDMIKPLLQGSFLYKKFANAQSLKRAAFDPLMADMYPIEACGYGIRSIKLHPNLDRIEIKHTYKSGVELTLPLERILRPMVPQITMDVLRIQKKIVSSGQTEEEIPELFGDVNTQAILAKRGVNSLNNGIEKYLSCSYYPFSLLLDKNGKVEFVASSYSVFKEWINGINMLLRYKKQLPQLRQKLKKT